MNWEWPRVLTLAQLCSMSFSSTAFPKRFRTSRRKTKLRYCTVYRFPAAGCSTIIIVRGLVIFTKRTPSLVTKGAINEGRYSDTVFGSGASGGHAESLPPPSPAASSLP